MGVFEVTVSGAVPAGVSKDHALSVLHNHATYFSSVDTYQEHTALPAGKHADKAPADIKARSTGTVKGYTVRNEVPNPVFDSKVITDYTVIDLTDGLWYYALSPMGVANEGLWTLKEVAGGLELYGTIQVDCSLVLRPVVKGQIQSASNQLVKNLTAAMQK